MALMQFLPSIRGSLLLCQNQKLFHPPLSFILSHSFSTSTLTLKQITFKKDDTHDSNNSIFYSYSNSISKLSSQHQLRDLFLQTMIETRNSRQSPSETMKEMREIFLISFRHCKKLRDLPLAFSLLSIYQQIKEQEFIEEGFKERTSRSSKTFFGGVKDSFLKNFTISPSIKDLQFVNSFEVLENVNVKELGEKVLLSLVETSIECKDLESTMKLVSILSRTKKVGSSIMEYPFEISTDPEFIKEYFIKVSERYPARMDSILKSLFKFIDKNCFSVPEIKSFYLAIEPNCLFMHHYESFLSLLDKKAFLSPHLQLEIISDMKSLGLDLSVTIYNMWLDVSLKLGKKDQILNILLEMKEKGKQFNDRTFEILSDKKNNHILNDPEIQHLIKDEISRYEQNPSLSISELNSLILFYGLTSPEKSFGCLQILRKQNLQPNKNTIQYLLQSIRPDQVNLLLKYVLQLPPHQDLYEPFFKYYKFQGQSENAINLYEQIENENFSFNPIVYIEMVKHYLKHYQTSRAIAVLSAWTDQPLAKQSNHVPYAFSLISNACFNHQRFPEVKNLLSIMGKPGHFNEKAFVKLMSVKLKGLTSKEMVQLKQSCSNIIKEHSKPFQTNPYLWSSVFRFFEALDRPDISLYFINEMRESESYPADIRIYNSLLGVYTEELEFQNAFGQLKTIMNKRIAPDQTTFHLLIRLLASIGDKTTAIKTFTRMKQLNLTPTLDTYLTIIKIYCKKNPTAALKLIQEIRQTYGTSSIQNCFSLIIDGIGREKGLRPESLKKALNLFRKAPQLGIEIDSTLYAIIIRLAISHSDKILAKKLLDEAFEKIPKPDISLYNQKINLMASNRELNSALNVYLSLKDHPTQKPNAETYLLLIRLYFLLPIPIDQVVESCRQSFSELLGNPSISANKIKLSKIFAGYMKTLGVHSQVEEIADVYSKMKTLGFKPTLETYNELLADFGKFENIKMVEMVHSDMLKNGIKPNAKTYSILTNICRIDPLSIAISIPENDSKQPRKFETIVQEFLDFASDINRDLQKDDDHTQ